MTSPVVTAAGDPGDGVIRIRVGDWMQTYTGRRFYPMDPRAEDIDPEDIAHALSLLCRYGGHVDRFYSVAEHCVLMSEALEAEGGRGLALMALLHDATEAYVVDVPRPLKRYLPEYRAIEDEVWTAIAGRVRVPIAMPAQVKIADTRILVDERESLLARSEVWELGVERLGVEIECWAPLEAENRYLRRLAELLR